MHTGSQLTVCEAFDRVVRVFRNYEAAVDGVSRLTFGELDEASRRCVSLLRAHGVVPGARVGLLTQPSTVHLVAWLAVVRLGAIPVVFHTREVASLLARLCDKFDIDLVMYDSSLESLVADMAQVSASSVTGIALRRLPAASQTGIYLADVHGLPHDEIAQLMNITLTTVASRLYRGRQKIREMLTETEQKCQVAS